LSCTVDSTTTNAVRSVYYGEVTDYECQCHNISVSVVVSTYPLRRMRPYEVTIRDVRYYFDSLLCFLNWKGNYIVFSSAGNVRLVSRLQFFNLLLVSSGNRIGVHSSTLDEVYQFLNNLTILPSCGKLCLFSEKEGVGIETHNSRTGHFRYMVDPRHPIGICIIDHLVPHYFNLDYNYRVVQDFALFPVVLLEDDAWRCLLYYLPVDVAVQIHKIYTSVKVDTCSLSIDTDREPYFVEAVVKSRGTFAVLERLSESDPESDLMEEIVPDEDGNYILEMGYESE